MCIIDCPTTTIHGHRREALIMVLSTEGSWVEAQMGDPRQLRPFKP